MNAVELNNVTFSYEDGINILENASFTAEYNKITLVAGHSGCGKSTLLSIISGIIPNVNYGNLTGEVSLAGVSIIGKRLGEICRILGVVLQNADEQIIHKTVEDEISFGCENLAFSPDLIEKQILTVCKLMKLDRKAYTRGLSGGEKQRLITASTLAMGQKIIVLDEPLANLDKAGSIDLMTTLRKLTKAGYAVIIVEHRLDVVLPFVDDVYHIGDKKIQKVNDKINYLEEQSKKILDNCWLFKGNDCLLDLQNISYKIKDKVILKDINCKIYKNSRTVLLGENGCGKTTLLRLISRLIKPSTGNIIQYIDPLFDKKKNGIKEWYKKVGIVYQNPDYQLFMPTVRKELYFAASSKEYADEIAEIFGLSELLDRHPQSLSEGQKRRLSIATVVATKPDLLLLDEPTVGQDYEGLDKLVHILNDLHDKQDFTMITITHDIRCAEALCDKALLLKDGVIIKTGDKSLVRDYFDNKI